METQNNSETAEPANEVEIETRPEVVFQTKPNPAAHSFANILYWISFSLLLIAARELISPGTRKAGQINHIFITIIAFEVYMWLLVGLNKWHFTKKLLIDSTRSMIFTLSLSGFLFMTLNEMYLIDTKFGLILSVAALATCICRMIIMHNSTMFKIPKDHRLYILGWLILIAAPAPLFKVMDDTACYLNSILYCWIVTIYLTIHVYAIKTQRERKFNSGQENPFQNWYASWAVLGIMFILATAQCVSVIYVFADYSFWFFSPLFITAGVLAVALAHTCRKGIALSWALLIASLFFLIMSAASPSLPNYFPSCSGPASNTIVSNYNQLGYQHLLHPVIPAILYGSFVFTICGIVLTAWWMLFISAIAPFTMGGIKAALLVSKCKNGKGFAMMLAAFLLLGGAIAIQWAQEKWGKKHNDKQITLAQQQP